MVFIDRQPAVIAKGTCWIDDAQVTLTPQDGVVFYPCAAPDTATARKSASFLFHVLQASGS